MLFNHRDKIIINFKAMKVGSLVECVNNENFNPIKGCVKPELNTIYTVREVLLSYEFKVPMIFLEEIVNATHPQSGKEYGYQLARFRELLPPINLEQELKQEELVTI